MLREIQSITEDLIHISDYIDAKIKNLQTQSINLPKGSVQSKKNDKHRYFNHCVYVEGKRIHRYVSKDEAARLQGLTQKRRFLEMALKYCIKIQSILPNYVITRCMSILDEMKKHQDRADKKMQATISLQNDEERQIYLEALGMSFPKLQGGETIRLHKTNNVLQTTSSKLSGHKSGNIETFEEDTAVRSKSELIIIEQLKAKGLEYYFETGVFISNRTFYPDFLIRHPVSGDFIIWEHCGLMSDGEYHNKWLKKLYAYAKEDIRPCSNLILTYEDNNAGFSIRHIRDVVNYYFA